MLSRKVSIEVSVLTKLRGKFSGPTLFIGLAMLIFPLWGSIGDNYSITAGLGYALLFTGCIYSLWYFRSSIGLGSKIIWIPVAVFPCLAILRVFYNVEPLEIATYYALFMLGLFTVFIIVRYKGPAVLWFIPYLVLIYGVSTIATTVYRPLEEVFRAHGVSGNPNMVAACLSFALFTLRGKWRWLSPLALVAIGCTGSYWALGAVGIAGLVFLIKGGIFNYKWVLVTNVVVILLALGIGFAFRDFSKTWNFDRVGAILRWETYEEPSLPAIVREGNGTSEDVSGITESGIYIGAVTTRFDNFKMAFDDFEFMGNGFRSNQPALAGRPGEVWIIHNVPLMIMDELGVPAVLAWFFLMGYAIWKSNKYRYVFIAMFVMSVTGTYWFWYWPALLAYFWMSVGLVSYEKEQGRRPNAST